MIVFPASENKIIKFRKKLGFKFQPRPYYINASHYWNEVHSGVISKSKDPAPTSTKHLILYSCVHFKMKKPWQRLRMLQEEIKLCHFQSPDICYPELPFSTSYTTITYCVRELSSKLNRFLNCLFYYMLLLERHRCSSNYLPGENSNSLSATNAALAGGLGPGNFNLL